MLTIRSLSLPFGCLPQLNHARAEKLFKNTTSFHMATRQHQPHTLHPSTPPPLQHSHKPQIQFQGRLFNQTPMLCNLFCTAVLTIRSLSLPFGCLPQLNHARAEKLFKNTTSFHMATRQHQPHTLHPSTPPPLQHSHKPQIQFQGRLFNQTPMLCNLFCTAVLTIRSLSLPFGCLLQLNHARAEKCI